jgi:hypothetical protein
MMTTTHRYEPAELDITIDELHLPEQMRRQSEICARRTAVETLDLMVRRLLSRLAADIFTQVQPPTIYDAIYPATPEVGGFWTVAARWVGLFTHTISTYTVSLAFDDHNHPDHFIVTGAREMRTAGVSEAALAQAVDSVRRTGPLTTMAPHAFAGFAL